MKSLLVIHVFASLTAVGLVSVGTPLKASACVNESYAATDRDVQETQRLERLLRAGRTEAVWVEMATIHERVYRADDVDHRTRALQHRLDFIQAVAVIRLGGAVTYDAVDRTLSDAEKREKLDEATEFLGAMTNPRARARYAEGLVALDRNEEAGRILRELSQEDLMPDAWGFRTLARIEHGLGNVRQRDLAQTACEARVSNARRRASTCPAFAGEGVVVAEGECSTRVHDPDSPLNVRRRPGGQSDVVGTLEHGTVLEVGRTRGRWLQVRAPLVGWVWSEGTRRTCPEAS